MKQQKTTIILVTILGILTTIVLYTQIPKNQPTNTIQTKDDSKKNQIDQITFPPQTTPSLESTKNAQNVWIKPTANPILYPTQPWEDKAVFEPTVLYEDGIYKMWYTGGLKCAVGYATSTDGINWQKYENNPVLGIGKGGEETMACRNNVIKYNGMYYLYYINDTREMYLATSVDGITFNKHPKPVLTRTENTWENNLANSFQWQEGDIWYMIYESGGSDGLGLWRMGLAIGTDPYTWKKYPGNPLTSLQVGKGMYGGPWVKKIGDTYYLWHHAAKPADNLPTDIYLQSSKDLQNWTLVSNEPQVARTQKEWEYDQVADPYILEANGRTILYYDGDDNTIETGYRAWIGYVYYDGPLSDIVK